MGALHKCNSTGLSDSFQQNFTKRFFLKCPSSIQQKFKLFGFLCSVMSSSIIALLLSSHLTVLSAFIYDLITKPLEDNILRSKLKNRLMKYMLGMHN